MNHLVINSRSLCCVGDIHGAFEGLIGWFRQYDLQDATLVFCGDIGLGFESEAYYKQIFAKLNRECGKRNLTLIFVRGNHDDPTYFANQKINYSNIKSVPDYTILSVAGHTVLCVGGGISIDRLYRQTKMMVLAVKYARFHGCSLEEAQVKSQRLYWEYEAPVYNEQALQEIAAKGVQIDVVCSHAAPSFCEPINKEGIENWLAADANLEQDLIKERATMDQIYECILAQRHPLKTWCYGHYHFHNVMEYNSIDFRLLDMSYRNANYDMYEFRRSE